LGGFGAATPCLFRQGTLWVEGGHLVQRTNPEYLPFELQSFHLPRRGYTAGLPLYKLLGAKAKAVPVYASGGLWLGSSLNEIISDAQDYIKLGYSALKIRVGQPRLEDDIKRVLKLRETVGPEVKLIADANQG